MTWRNYVARWSWLPWLLVAGCEGACHAQPVVVVPNVAPVDASPDVVVACAQACVHVSQLCAGCSLNDAGRDPACERDQAQGVAAQLDVACVLRAGSVTEAQHCGACR